MKRSDLLLNGITVTLASHADNFREQVLLIRIVAFLEKCRGGDSIGSGSSCIENQ